MTWPVLQPPADRNAPKLPYTESDVRQWAERIKEHPYRSYLYSYPHKTAYRELAPALPLKELWRQEPAESYFLYMHIPFCGARCGFCNLFTLPDKRDDVHVRYVDALERQAREWADMITGKPYARFAIGGGTPTLLPAVLLERLFHIAYNIMRVERDAVSISVEASPETITPEKLDVLRAAGVDRISMGIQSFVDAEASAIYRPQPPKLVHQALSLLTSYNFPIVNLDLIYGLPGQTVESWLYSLEEALKYDPGEIFLYPLYTRDHTIVKPERMDREPDLRLDCYIAARDMLTERGYAQSSMRRFAKVSAASSSGKSLLDYSCQEEGMVGLGCGARSYTRGAHYASRYGVSRKATESIIADYVAAETYDTANYGIVLGKDEQRRRFMLKAILHQEGLHQGDYRSRFGTEMWNDYPELTLLLHSGLATLADGLLRLTPEGFAYSDSIGDWLISGDIRDRMERFVVL